MRVVIVGAGLAGTNLARELVNNGHQVTLVDRDSGMASRGFLEHGLSVIVGDGTDPRVLAEADAGRANIVAAMLRRDADNLAIAMIARTLGAERLLARLRDPSYRTVYRDARIDQVFSEIETMVGALATAIEHPRVQHSMVIGDGGSIAFEIAIPDDAPVAGQTLRDIGSASGFPRAAVVAGVTSRDGPLVVPRGESIVRGGDTVLIVAPRDAVAKVIAFFAGGEAS
jgi:trk system potassium uptake protein